jgi:hypothetical protein
LRAAAACVSDRPLLATGYRFGDQPHLVFFAPRDVPVALDSPAGKRGVVLVVRVWYRLASVVGDRPAWRADQTGYAYGLADRDGRELLAYHWHPEALGPPFPHVHLTGRLPAIEIGPGFSPVALGDMHLPTGRIAFAAVARLLISEFGISPLHPDWAMVLDQADRDERQLWSG